MAQNLLSWGINQTRIVPGAFVISFLQYTIPLSDLIVSVNF